ncbi:ABC transporter substrate-binding protein [Christensenellaceae bacterium OttesenSCG-928-L17]|nr:ABC transporter substrate-binding protein [Christensenellaceae bacterium OttesenSCG-928-L17]
MKKLTVLLLLSLFALTLVGCGKNAAGEADDGLYDDLIVVGFSQVGAESDWRAANTKSMQEALSEANGYKLIFDDAQQKQERQITAIRNFVQQEVDYIVLAPTTETGWDTVLQEAKTAGIPIIIVDRMIEVEDDSLFTCWIGSDFRKEGDTAVQWLAQRFVNTPVNIVHLQGNLGSTAQIGRTESLDAGLRKHENWTLLARESGEFTQAKGQEVMESFLEQRHDFNVVFSENDNMTYGAIDALEAVGLKPGKDVVVVSFDANRKALEMTLDGQINCNIECNPLHGPRVQAIIQQLEAGEMPQKFTYVEETAFYAETITREIIDNREY